jgi:hypothetical protein
MNNSGGEPFGDGGNNAPRGSGSSLLGGSDNDFLGGGCSGLLRGGGSGFLGGGGSGPLVDQNLRSYGVRPIWNLWYPSWYPI